MAGAGNHDHRGYPYDWGENWQGWPEVSEDGDNYESQANHLFAENLEGRLLVPSGAMDSNVHPSLTLLLMDAHFGLGTLGEVWGFSVRARADVPSRGGRDPGSLRKHPVKLA